MPRPLRIWFPGAIYHVIARGNNRQPVFLQPMDYLRYLSLLEKGRTRFGYELWAYVLMPNHFHLLIRSGEERSISKAMQWLQTSYTVYFNGQHEHVGHVFQGRFKSQLVDLDAYCLELSRYIHLNPVRAKMVRDPDEYYWSSYRVYVGEGVAMLQSAVQVETEPILGMVSPVELERPSVYKFFVKQGVRPQTLLRV